MDPAIEKITEHINSARRVRDDHSHDQYRNRTEIAARDAFYECYIARLEMERATLILENTRKKVTHD